MVQLRGWMIPAEAFPGKFVTLKGACGKTKTTNLFLKIPSVSICSPGPGFPVVESAKRMSTGDNPAFCKVSSLFVKSLPGCFFLSLSSVLFCLIARIFQVSKHAFLSAMGFKFSLKSSTIAARPQVTQPQATWALEIQSASL